MKTIKKKCEKQAEISEDYGMRGSDSFIDYSDWSDILGLNTPEKLRDSSIGHVLETGDLPKSHTGLIVLLVMGIICSM